MCSLAFLVMLMVLADFSLLDAQIPVCQTANQVSSNYYVPYTQLRAPVTTELCSCPSPAVDLLMEYERVPQQFRNFTYTCSNLMRGFHQDGPDVYRKVMTNCNCADGYIEQKKSINSSGYTDYLCLDEILFKTDQEHCYNYFPNRVDYLGRCEDGYKCRASPEHFHTPPGLLFVGRCLDDMDYGTQMVSCYLVSGNETFHQRYCNALRGLTPYPVNGFWNS